MVHKFANTAVYAINETACWMDMPSSSTIDDHGARSVPLKTTGDEKDHFTVILTAGADGKNLNPLLFLRVRGLASSRIYRRFRELLSDLVAMVG